MVRSRIDRCCRTRENSGAAAERKFRDVMGAIYAGDTA